jgi:tetratricopeptide (TPR) repeat protein
MTLHSVRVTCFTLLAALQLCAANGPQTQGTAADKSQSIQAATPDASSSPITQRTALVEPTLAEMRAMTPEQLDAVGDRLKQGKDYLGAVDCYREAIRKHATAEYYNKVAVSELLLRRPAEAEKFAKKAVRKDKHLAEAWNNLGVARYMKEIGNPRPNFEDAIRTYERAISLKPDFASFHNNLATALMDSKQFDRGMAEYRKAFQLDRSFFEHASQNGISAHMGSPQDRAQFFFVMARLFAGTGDLDRALHFLRSAIEDGYPKINDVYREKEFANVVTDERFLALMKDRPVAVR